jgi:hypothetical protein
MFGSTEKHSASLSTGPQNKMNKKRDLSFRHSREGGKLVGEALGWIPAQKIAGMTGERHAGMTRVGAKDLLPLQRE